MKTVKFKKSDCWDLFTLLAKINGDAIRKFRKTNNTSASGGYPSDLTEDEWDEILKKIEKAFKLIVEDNLPTTEEDEKIIEEGLTLFAKRFRNLWI